VLALAGCGASINAATDKPYNPTNGAEAVVGDIHVANLLVVTGIDSAEVYAGIVNSGDLPDALTAVEVEKANPVTVAEPIILPPSVNVTLGPPGTNRIFLTGFTGKPGDLVDVTLTFRDAGTVTLTTTVLDQQDLGAAG
jgi:copper(I)-binding protein